MDLPNLKELDKMIALCRKRGVTVIKIGALELQLGDAPKAQSRKDAKGAAPKASQFNEKIDTDGWDSLSPEQKLFFSSDGFLPPNDSDPASE